jgi:hypothetical protein
MTRGLMESRFGHDFADVRVHTDVTAAQSARALDAQAYTVGGHVVFSQGSYTPHDRQGSRLLAHELAHVIQQQRGGAAPPSLHGGPLEQHADAAAAAFASGGGPIHVGGASTPGVARQPAQKGKQRLREMLKLDPSKPEERKLGDELDVIENLLNMTGKPLTDVAILEKAMELHKSTQGTFGNAVLAFYDRLAARMVGGMLATASAPVVMKKDPSGEWKVVLRAGELALAHKNLQIETALNLIQGFATAGAVVMGGALAVGLVMLAATAAPAIFGAYATISSMTAEAAMALALRLGPKLVGWALANPYVAQAVVLAVVSTVLELAETGSVDPMGVIFNLAHIKYTRGQTQPRFTPPSGGDEPPPPPPPAKRTIPASPPPPPKRTIVASPPPPPAKTPMPGRRGGPVAVTDGDVVASNARDPSSIKPQNPTEHQKAWQAAGGSTTAPLAYRDRDGTIRIRTDHWLLASPQGGGVPLGSTQLPPRVPSNVSTSQPKQQQPPPPAADIGLAKTGQASAPPNIDALGQTPQAPIAAPQIAPPPAGQNRPGAGTAQAGSDTLTPQAPPPRVRGQVRMFPRDPPQGVSIDRARQMAQNNPDIVGRAINSDEHRRAWQLLGGRVDVEVPSIFFCEGKLWVDPGRHPPGKPLSP